MKTKNEIIDAMNLPKVLKFVKDNLIFLCLSGSRAYGTCVEPSDWDYRGLCIEPMEYALGAKNFEQTEDKKNDTVVYGLKKFLTLAKTVNPNILDIIFSPESHIVYIHPVMRHIVENRSLFVSKKAFHTFAGYSFSQIKRMKTHKKWIDRNLEKPNRELMGLPINPKMSQEKLMALAMLGREDLLTFVKSEDVEYIIKEVEYIDLKKEWDRYSDWVKNRNEKRAELEKAYLYDSKAMLHVFRLIRASKELAETGSMSVFRPDREFLLDIRNGKFSYEELMEMAEKEEALTKVAYDNSKLPYSVDQSAIDNIYLEMIKEFHGVTWNV
jgi:predicted nucleotidyltransferase